MYGWFLDLRHSRQSGGVDEYTSGTADPERQAEDKELTVVPASCDSGGAGSTAQLRWAGDVLHQFRHAGREEVSAW